MVTLWKPWDNPRNSSLPLSLKIHVGGASAIYKFDLPRIISYLKSKWNTLPSLWIIVQESPLTAIAKLTRGIRSVRKFASLHHTGSHLHIVLIHPGFESGIFNSKSICPYWRSIVSDENERSSNKDMKHKNVLLQCEWILLFSKIVCISLVYFSWLLMVA